MGYGILTSAWKMMALVYLDGHDIMASQSVYPAHGRDILYDYSSIVSKY